MPAQAVQVRLPRELIDAIDAITERDRRPGETTTRSDTIRRLLLTHPDVQALAGR